MKRITKKQLKELARDGLAKDITRYDFDMMEQFLNAHSLIRVAVSRGANGMNGGLLKDVNTCEKFVITARNTALFMAF